MFACCVPLYIKQPVKFFIVVSHSIEKLSMYNTSQRFSFALLYLLQITMIKSYPIYPCFKAFLGIPDKWYLPDTCEGNYKCN